MLGFGFRSEPAPNPRRAAPSKRSRGLLQTLAVFEDVFDEGARRGGLEAAEGDDGDGAREAVAGVMSGWPRHLRTYASL